MPSKYQDLHRLTLQWIMSQKIVTEKKANQIYQRACEICNVHYNPSDFGQCIMLINEQLKPLSMEIRSGKSEHNGVMHYSLVNCFEDEHSKMATDLSANEIAFFRKVLESIIMSDDGQNSLIHLIHVGLDLPIKINPTAAESLLVKLVDEKWLVEIDGNISLGPRTIIELGVYLKNIYPEDIPDCKLCMYIVVKGQTCGNCGVRVHLYCSNTFFKDRPPSTRKCPGCAINWLHEVPSIISEATATEIETARSPTGSERQQLANGNKSSSQLTT